MKRGQVHAAIVGVALIGMGVVTVSNGSGIWGSKTAQSMAEKANAFTASLTPEQRKKAQYAFTDAERHNWHFVPIARNGLPLREMNEVQRKKALAFFKTGLSAKGYQRAQTIMSLENVLKEMEKGAGPVRDAEGYFFTLFGIPSADAPWGWRVEGHHLSFNFTIVGGKLIANSPTFLGSNPADVKTGAMAGTRALKETEDLGRQLFLSLTPEQKAQAVFAEKALPDIITGDKKRVEPLSPVGIVASALTKEQQRALDNVIKAYTETMPSELAKARSEKVKAAGKDKLFFAWAGSGEKYQGHYYRIQGPAFLIEYDNTQNNANHIHSVWRDFDGDFGEDMLKAHYAQEHGK
jgi:hypothetical protein